MRLISFNVNSVRVRLHQLQAIIERHSPEVIGIQETKVPDDQFPVDEISELGYHVQFHGQKPVKVIKGFSQDDDASQRRFIRCDFSLSGDRLLGVINSYFPQGENRSHSIKFPGKQKFYADLQDFISSEHKPEDLLIIMGDMNIAPVDNDIGIGEKNMKRWLKDGKTCFLPEEREWIQKLLDWGMVDTYRAHYPDVDNLFSWFDYRSRGFERDPKRGLRIDLILASTGASLHSTDAGIDYEIRAMDKPSDHCPIWSELAL